MNIQQVEVLVSIPQPDIIGLEQRYLDKVKYFLTRTFSCWHLRLSRPFTHNRESYVACLRCGMRRKFDLKAWKSIGNYYAPEVDWPRG